MNKENSEISGVTLSVVKQLQNELGLTASKALGQNFLIDPNISRKIARSCKEGDTILEIGPGAGSLTVALGQACEKVIAVEYDTHVLKSLNKVLQDFGLSEKVDIIHNDIMKVDIEKLCLSNGISTVIGNLPYNISATLLADIARFVPSAKLVVAMVQKEVGERLASPQKSRGVSGVTLKSQLFMDIAVDFSVPRQSFIPQPRVDSVVITMKRRETMAAGICKDEIEDLFSIIDHAFGKRRKMLRQSLKELFGEDLDRIFSISGLDPTLRPEQCDLSDFALLLKAWKEK